MTEGVFWYSKFCTLDSGQRKSTGKTSVYKWFLKKRRPAMGGYFTEEGFMGLVDGEYRLFSDEGDYYEYMRG